MRSGADKSLHKSPFSVTVLVKQLNLFAGAFILGNRFQLYVRQFKLPKTHCYFVCSISFSSWQLKKPNEYTSLRQDDTPYYPRVGTPQAVEKSFRAEFNRSQNRAVLPCKHARCDNMYYTIVFVVSIKNLGVNNTRSDLTCGTEPCIKTGRSPLFMR